MCSQVRKELAPALRRATMIINEERGQALLPYLGGDQGVLLPYLRGSKGLEFTRASYRALAENHAAVAGLDLLQHRSVVAEVSSLFPACLFR